ncbi:hypothetical protein ACFX2I_045436 [Malus domestica]
MRIETISSQFFEEGACVDRQRQRGHSPKIEKKPTESPSSTTCLLAIRPTSLPLPLGDHFYAPTRIPISSSFASSLDLLLPRGPEKVRTPPTSQELLRV